jgi:hypothetical protein
MLCVRALEGDGNLARSVEAEREGGEEEVEEEGGVREGVESGADVSAIAAALEGAVDGAAAGMSVTPKFNADASVEEEVASMSNELAAP